MAVEDDQQPDDLPSEPGDLSGARRHRHSASRGRRWRLDSHSRGSSGRGGHGRSDGRIVNHGTIAKGRHGPLRRWATRVLAAVVALAILMAAAMGALLLAVPSVANAPRRVDGYLSAHGGHPIPSPPPKRLAASVTAIEDHFVSAPPGIDIAYGALRYGWDHLVLGEPAQGGSTIAQQLAKRIYTGPGTGVSVKLTQIGLAFKLELTYSPSQLLSMYLNDDYFGDGAYGVAQASEKYFQRTPAQLSWAQAAMLAGLVQAPSVYDPFVHPNLARNRQLAVIAQLVSTGALTQAQARAVRNEPLDLR